MSIEALERAAAADREHWTAGMKKQSAQAAAVVATEDAQRVAEANAAFIAMDECGTRLQALYDTSHRSIKDRLHTVLQQITNSKEELKQVFRTIRG
jgi:hypothetical protein